MIRATDVQFLLWTIPVDCCEGTSGTEDAESECSICASAPFVQFLESMDPL